ncbi:MAG: hypothetical protein LUG85_08310, partial [Clostridiales bacterium]|nr:hypothetical protein [Clostridiales bacterium]
DGSSESVTLKTDGKNIKMTTTMDMDSFGEYAISVITVPSTDLLGNETTTTYIACDNTGKKMPLSTLQAAVEILGGGELDELNIEDYTVEIDEDTDSLHAYVTTETGTDGVEYTVYSADTSDGMVKFYFDEDGIASVIKYSTAGFVQKKFMFDEFYTDISDSEFDISVYEDTASLTALFGVSIL